ncbi:hypothetical protein [Kitasatospora sp. MBT63]|uniref:hypothetical protein n=1 Tax=Kitasatospora sp. MBT63 TaxID=1444768 RepID=UPI00053B694B|nr:hypothetical protein [Kitasatospora sp. MBT63]
MGNSFGTRAAFNDQWNEKPLGTLYSTCSKVEAGPDQLLCSSVVKYSPDNLVTLSVVVPADEAAAKEFIGTVTGGTGVYQGVTGAAVFELKDGNYQVTFP